MTLNVAGEDVVGPLRVEMVSGRVHESVVAIVGSCSCLFYQELNRISYLHRMVCVLR
ncbi:hypothetical protein HanHA300_Chr05g0190931 [Helianthus annuus]|nr:hypothetical protein HanHA300_Chr05g0190931 [Helianthus annuus]